MGYYQITATKELTATYYVKADNREEAEEIALEKFDEELEREQFADYDYHTLTEEAASDWSDEWLMEDENGDVVEMNLEEDFLAAVNMGGE